MTAQMQSKVTSLT